MSEYQHRFVDALLDPAKPVPSELVVPNGESVDRRFNIYRNNVIVSLIEALAEAFPVVRAIVGDAFFDAMAGVYVRAHPPSSPRMMFYGADLADFLNSFEPAAQLAYLPDVARLEHARRVVYHAADDPVADLSILGACDATTITRARFELRAACCIIRSSFPVYSIWRFNATKDRSPVGHAAEDVLVSRPEDAVLVNRLPPGGADFLGALQSGQPLGQAADRAVGVTPEFDLNANLAALFAKRIIKTVSISDPYLEKGRT